MLCPIELRARRAHGQVLLGNRSTRQRRFVGLRETDPLYHKSSLCAFVRRDHSRRVTGCLIHARDDRASGQTADQKSENTAPANPPVLALWNRSGQCLTTTGPFAATGSPTPDPWLRRTQPLTSGATTTAPTRHWTLSRIFNRASRSALSPHRSPIAPSVKIDDFEPLLGKKRLDLFGNVPIRDQQ
jgi:hypothetical protein